jgi:opacity protein-like surface antigen
MKRKIILAMCGASLIVAAAGASAEKLTEGFYLGGGYTAATYSESGFPDADLGALFIRGGYQINDYVASEIRIGDGVEDDTVHVFGESVKVKAKEFYGIYLKAGIPTDVGLYPYAIAGGTHLKMEASVPGYSTSDSDSDISYGLGVDYWFNKSLSAGLEYMKLYDKDSTEVTGVTLGLNYKF